MGVGMGEVGETFGVEVSSPLILIVDMNDIFECHVSICLHTSLYTTKSLCEGTGSVRII